MSDQSGPKWRWHRPFPRRVTGWPVLLAVLLALSAVVFAAGCGDDEEKGKAVLTNLTATAMGSPNTITVMGKATVTAAPDEAVVTLSVENDGPDPGASMDANSQTTKKVMERLKAEGVEEKAIETSNVSVYPVRTYNPETGQETLAGYRTQNTITVTLKDAATVARVLAASIEAGATNISNLVWKLADDSAVVNEALTKAVTNAKTKAEALAGAQGVKVGEVIMMNESNVEVPIVPIYAQAYDLKTAGGSSVAEPPISAASLDVTASVTVTYALAR